jgi:hypothetical protein
MDIEIPRRWLPPGCLPLPARTVTAHIRGKGRQGIRRRWWRGISGLLLVTLGLAVGAARAAEPQLRLPPWESLEFEKRAFGMIALSHVEIGVDPLDARFWTLNAASSLAGNTERVQLRMEPGTGRLLEQTRLSQGSDRRFKLYRYLPDRLVRERREPTGEADTPPEQWPLSSTLETAFPAGEGDLRLTASYGLLVFADNFYREGDRTADLLVHADLSFYHIRLKRRRGPEVDVDYLVAGSRERVHGRHPTVAIKVRGKALNEADDPQDYDLLGLRGDIDILFDTVTGLPVRLRGDAPRIGSSTIDLRGVSFREQEE